METKIEDTELYTFSPCCHNSLAKDCGMDRYKCVKCGKVWLIKLLEHKK